MFKTAVEKKFEHIFKKDEQKEEGERIDAGTLRKRLQSDPLVRRDRTYPEPHQASGGLKTNERGSYGAASRTEGPPGRFFP